MDRVVIKNQALRTLYKAADSFTSRDPIKVPGIKGEPGSANLHPRAAGETTDEKTAASTCCKMSKPVPHDVKKVKRASPQMRVPSAGDGTVQVPAEVAGGAINGAFLGSMALPGLAGAGVGAGYGLLNPGRDEEGKRKSRLLAALKYGLLGGVGGAAAGPVGALGALGGGIAGAAHGASKLQDAEISGGPRPSPRPSQPMERRAAARQPLAVKLAMMTTTPNKQSLPIGQSATQRQRDQATATLKQNGRII